MTNTPKTIEEELKEALEWIACQTFSSSFESWESVVRQFQSEVRQALSNTTQKDS